MLDDLLRIPFEFFVTVIWDRYGPVAGVLAAVTMLGVLAGLVILAFKYGPNLFGLT